MKQVEKSLYEHVDNPDAEYGYDYLFECISTDEDIESDVEYDDMISRLPKALDKLSQRDKIIFQLHYIEQMSYKDISIITGIPEQNLTVLCEEIIIKMKKYLNWG